MLSGRSMQTFRTNLPPPSPSLKMEPDVFFDLPIAMYYSSRRHASEDYSPACRRHVQPYIHKKSLLQRQTWVCDLTHVVGGVEVGLQAFLTSTLMEVSEQRHAAAPLLSGLGKWEAGWCRVPGSKQSSVSILCNWQEQDYCSLVVKSVTWSRPYWTTYARQSVL
jgi:hypothetical protein